MKKITTMDLTPLLGNRVHLTGFDCTALRALRAVKAVALNGRQVRVEFWQTSTTNPAKVNCTDCWRENPTVNRTYIPYVVIRPIGRTHAP